MPEYSSTNITPADGVQTPAMNGSTSGNYTLAELRNFILASKGLANGLASLDANGKLPVSQLPDLADDVIVVASYAVLPATGTAGKLYITADNNKGYRWDPDLATPAYVLLFNPADIDTIVRIISGAQVVGKAAADGNGNNIVETYATKTALQEEVEAREAADASLSEALETYETTNDLRVAANSQDIQNIQNALSGTVIQEHIDSTQKNVKSILSADELLPWAILKRVGARSTQFNQLVQNGNFANGTSNWNSYAYSPLSVQDGVASFTAQYQYTPIYQTGFGDFIDGHVYLLSCEMKVDSPANGISFGIGSTNVVYSNCVLNSASSGEWQRMEGKITFSSLDPTERNKIFVVDLRSSGWSTIQVKNIMVIDLTAMNEASLTADQFKAKFPASYYPFNAGDIYDVPPLSFLYRGTNQWNEEWENGTINLSTGADVPNSGYIRSKGYIEVTPLSTLYFCMAVGQRTDGMYVCYYDDDKNFIRPVLANSANSLSYQMPINCRYIRFYMAGDYGSTYNHDIMICLNSVTDKTYKPFIGQTIDTSFMAGKKYVNPNCYDYAENVYVNGILKRKNQTVVGSVDLGTLNWTRMQGSGYGWWQADISDIKRNDGVSVGNVSHAEYLAGTINQATMHPQDATYMCPDNSGNRIIINDFFLGNTQPSGILYYELATLPDPTYGDPIPNFPCEDGSTIMANTPQTEIVNAIDVPSTIGYSTKIV